MEVLNALFRSLFDLDSGFHILVWVLFVSATTAAFVPRFRMLAKIIFTLGILPIAFSLCVLLFVSVLGAGFSSSWVSVQRDILPGFLIGLGLLIAIAVGLLWYWLGSSASREKVLFAGYSSVMACFYLFSPITFCEAAYDFKLSWGAECLSDYYFAGSGANIFRATEYRRQAAEWGNEDIAFYLYQTDDKQNRQYWLELAASLGQLHARYKLFYPNPNAPIEDMKRMAEFAHLGQVDAQYHYGYWMLTQNDLVNAETMLVQAAEGGSILAQRTLAEEYLGIGLLGKRDVERSEYWRKRSGDLSERIRQELGARLRFYSEYLPEHYHQQALWENQFAVLSKQSEDGFSNQDEAQYAIGQRLLQLNDSTRKRGLEWLKNAAKNGNLDATQALHRFFKSGRKQDPLLQQEYLFYLERAGELGDYSAAYTLAYIYTNGEDGVKVDVNKASQYLELAIDGANTQGKRLNDIAGLSETLNIALKYAHEYGGDRQELESKVLNGDPEAMYYLALTLTEPIYHSAENVERFKELLRRSAELGYPPAQLREALAMNRASNDPAQQKLGFQWLTSAAKNGYAPAMYELGVFYLARRLPHPQHHYSPYRAKVLIEHALDIMATHKDQLYQDKNGEIWVYYHRYGTRAVGVTLKLAEQTRLRIPLELSNLKLDHSQDPLSDIKTWYYQEIDQLSAQGGDLEQLNGLYNALLKDPTAGDVHQLL